MDVSGSSHESGSASSKVDDSATCMHRHEYYSIYHVCCWYMILRWCVTAGDFSCLRYTINRITPPLAGKCGCSTSAHRDMDKYGWYVPSPSSRFQCLQCSVLILESCTTHTNCQPTIYSVSINVILRRVRVTIVAVEKQSSSSLGATALCEPWPPVLFASTGLYPELSFSILQSPSLVRPLERHLAI